MASVANTLQSLHSGLLVNYTWESSGSEASDDIIHVGVFMLCTLQLLVCSSNTTVIPEILVV